MRRLYSTFSGKLFFLFRGLTFGTLNFTFLGIRYTHIGASSSVSSFVGEGTITVVESAGEEGRAKDSFLEGGTSVLIGSSVGTEPRLISGISTYRGTHKIGISASKGPLVLSTSSTQLPS